MSRVEAFLRVFQHNLYPELKGFFSSPGCLNGPLFSKLLYGVQIHNPVVR
jgi:hypothetical protein